MTRSLFAGIVVVLLLLLSPGCGNSTSSAEPQGPTPEELISKSWKLQKLKVKDQATPPQIMTTSSFNFYKDGRYEILMGELERGTWKLSADKRILITLPTTGGENQIDIERLEANMLVLTNNAGPNPVRMELVPQ